METLTKTDSSKFPLSYGDFALLCSDGVVCYFPRYLLGYMSGLFKDMFDLPNSDAQFASPLPLTDPSRTIELLLQYMDPKSSRPDLDTNTIVDLLEAAQKYQVPTITAWFEKQTQIKTEVEYASGSPFHITGTPTRPILTENPLLVLYCALRFDLPLSGQLALREFIQCDASLIETTNQGIPLSVYLHGMNLRKKRMKLFRVFIKELATTKKERMVDQLTSRVTMKADLSRSTCASCTATRAIWIFNLESIVRDQPRWVLFASGYEASKKGCAKCGTDSWADYYREKLVDWQAKVEELEKALPEWPF